MKENQIQEESHPVFKLSAEQAAALPPGYPMFNICPGRYFAGMIYLPLKAGAFPHNLPYGGNITGLLWRYENAPVNDGLCEWHFTYRVMGYADGRSGHNPADKRNWRHFYEPEAFGAGDDILRRLADLIAISNHVAVPELFHINGDAEEFTRKMHANRPSFMVVRAVIEKEDSK